MLRLRPVAAVGSVLPGRPALPPRRQMGSEGDVPIPPGVPEMDHDLDSVIVFPGQGAQKVGMGSELQKFREVRNLYAVANEVLGYNLRDLCFKGPQEKLNKTIFCQPAIYVTNIAAAFRLRIENPKAVEQCTGVAGFSVGEISALAFAGAMTFEEGLHLVRVRAEAMQRCCDAEPSGMLTVILDDRSRRPQPLIEAALSHCRHELGMESPVLSVASYLYPGCRGLAGHVQALDFVQKHGADFGVRKAIRVPVSGAFHTWLMKPAANTIRHCLHRMVLSPPEVPVYFNRDGDSAFGLSRIASNVYKQVYTAVRWEQCLINMLARPEGVPLPRLYEVGPGRQLTTMLGRTNRKAYQRCSKVEV